MLKKNFFFSFSSKVKQKYFIKGNKPKFSVIKNSSRKVVFFKKTGFFSFSSTANCIAHIFGKHTLFVVICCCCFL